MNPDQTPHIHGDAADSDRVKAAASDLASQSEQALTAANIGTWVWQIDTGHLTWSDLTYSLYGVDKETFQVTPNAVRDLLHPEDRDRL
jgi:hypothetical protein